MMYLHFDQDLFLEANDRSRVTSKQQAKLQGLVPKEFEFNGTADDYAKQLFNNSNKREQRRLKRYDDKYYGNLRKKAASIGVPYRDLKKQMELADNPVEMMGGAYTPINHSIGINKAVKDYIEKNGGNIDPLLDHERQHAKQYAMAKQKYGVQGSRSMGAKYATKVYGKNKDKLDMEAYNKNPQEYEANLKGITGYSNDKLTSEVVDDGIKTKRRKRGRANISQELGIAKREGLFNKMKAGNQKEVPEEQNPEHVKKKAESKQNSNLYQPQQQQAVASIIPRQQAPVQQVQQQPIQQPAPQPVQQAPQQPVQQPQVQYQQNLYRPQQPIQQPAPQPVQPMQSQPVYTQQPVQAPVQQQPIQQQVPQQPVQQNLFRPQQPVQQVPQQQVRYQ